MKSIYAFIKFSENTLKSMKNYNVNYYVVCYTFQKNF